MIKKILLLLLSFGIGVALDFSDRCSTPCEISLGPGSLISSSTIDATTGPTLDVDLMRCDAGDNALFDTTNGGVFFTIEGTDAVMQASACSEEQDFQNRLSIFGSCEPHSCIISASANKEASNYTNDCSHGNSSIVEWQSKVGESYSIFVHDERATKSGRFKLGIKELLPDNGSCETAIDLVDSETVMGTTAGSSFAAIKSCESNITMSAEGVWYRIPADPSAGEKEVVVSVCSREPFEFSVFSDGDCNDLSCVETAPTSSVSKLCSDGTLESRVSWIDTEGSAYNLLLHAPSGALFRMAYARDPPYISSGAKSVTNLGWSAVFLLATLATL
jgi:hypothetical protein